MADQKISALTSASTPLAGTEVVPIVQSGATVKATIANIVGAGTSPGAFTTLTNTQLHTNYPQVTIGDIVASEIIAGRDVVVVGGTSQQVYNKLYRHTAGVNFIGTSWRLQNFADATGASYIQWGSPTEWNDIGLYNASDVGFRLSTAGNLTPNTAAKGINFTANTPAAGMTSQLLNWYEEGTWTPAQGAGLTLVGAFSSTGKYTRIGRSVTISGTVTGATSVAVTAAGVITNNLPFTAGTAGHGSATNAANTAFASVICTTTNVTSAGAIAATATITFSATYFV